jgi:hypothetical protein
MHGTWSGTWQLAPSSAQSQYSAEDLEWLHDTGPERSTTPAMPISAFAAASAIPFPWEQEEEEDGDSDGGGMWD